MDLAPWVTIVQRAQQYPSSVLLEHIMEIQVKLIVPFVQKAIIVQEDHQILLNVLSGISAPMGKINHYFINHTNIASQNFRTKTVSYPTFVCRSKKTYRSKCTR